MPGAGLEPARLFRARGLSPRVCQFHHPGNTSTIDRCGHIATYATRRSVVAPAAHIGSSSAHNAARTRSASGDMSEWTATAPLQGRRPQLAKDDLSPSRQQLQRRQHPRRYADGLSDRRPQFSVVIEIPALRTPFAAMLLRSRLTALAKSRAVERSEEWADDIRTTLPEGCHSHCQRRSRGQRADVESSQPNSGAHARSSSPPLRTSGIQWRSGFLIYLRLQRCIRSPHRPSHRTRYHTVHQ